MNTERKGVDVLAAIDEAIGMIMDEWECRSNPDPAARQKEARAAVADMIDLLRTLRDCGTWYNSALEIDMYAKGFQSGEELETRINDLLARVGGDNE